MGHRLVPNPDPRKRSHRPQSEHFGLCSCPRYLLEDYQTTWNGIPDTESNNAMNGWVFQVTAAEVRERRKEFGVMEVEFSCMTGAVLPLFGQLFKSTMLEKLPLSFPSLTLMVQAFVGLPPICSMLKGSPMLSVHLVVVIHPDVKAMYAWTAQPLVSPPPVA